MAFSKLLPGLENLTWWDPYKDTVMSNKNYFPPDLLLRQDFASNGSTIHVRKMLLILVEMKHSDFHMFQPPFWTGGSCF